MPRSMYSTWIFRLFLVLLAFAATPAFAQTKLWDSPALKTPFKENLSDDEKVAGLSHFWSEVKYNFANFDLVDGLDWDSLYMAYLPKVRATKSTLEYYELLSRMCAQLKDGHTNVYVPEELQERVYARPLLRTRFVENRVIVSTVYDDELRRKGLEPGVEVTAIDGVPVREYAEREVRPYESASTPQDLDVRTYEYALLGGAVGAPVRLTLADAKGRTFTVVAVRPSFAEAQSKMPATAPMKFEMMPGNIAYVQLNTFGNDEAAKQFEAAFEKIAASDALILDVRNNGGGSSEVGYRILSLLTDKPSATSVWHTRDYRPSFRAWGRPEEVFSGDMGRIEPDGKRHYAKPVVVLSGPRSFSAAEDFLVAFDVMDRGPIIGEPTGGSTGQPLFISLPGGGTGRICTKRDKYPDGREFIGVGVQPDILVRPTVADLRAGRDTVLEAALRTLKQKMAERR